MRVSTEVDPRRTNTHASSSATKNGSIRRIYFPRIKSLSARSSVAGRNLTVAIHGERLRPKKTPRVNKFFALPEIADHERTGR